MWAEYLARGYNWVTLFMSIALYLNWLTYFLEVAQASNCVSSIENVNSICCVFLWKRRRFDPKILCNKKTSFDALGVLKKADATADHLKRIRLFCWLDDKKKLYSWIYWQSRKDILWNWLWYQIGHKEKKDLSTTYYQHAYIGRAKSWNISVQKNHFSMPSLCQPRLSPP